MALNDLALALADRIDKATCGVETWRVMNRAETAFCIEFDAQRYSDPKRECTKWLDDERKRNPAWLELHGYHAVRTFILSHVDELARDAAAMLRSLAGDHVSRTWRVVPHPKLKRDYAKRQVRTRVEMKNGWGVIPAGTLATVDAQGRKGSTLLCEPCESCGRRATISAIQPDDIEFVEPANDLGEAST